MTADQFLDGELKAVKPVQVYSSPDSKTVLKTVQPGGIVGTIFSWVTRGNDVWWQLDNNTFVKHAPDLFDVNHLGNSIKIFNEKKQAEIDKKVAERLAANTNPLYTIGKSVTGLFSNMNLIILSVIAIVILILVIKIKQ